MRYYELDTKTDIIPEPKDFQQLGKRKNKLRKVEVDTETCFQPKRIPPCHQRGQKPCYWSSVAWAKSTLAQLTDENGKVPKVVVHDWASYPFRGFMHDTGRNYQSVSLLKETLDLMAFYKLNYFHWHLTDHPAWRNVTGISQLNDPQYHGAQARRAEFLHTYDEIRELIAYARERGITVVPEIDMPGHSTYFKDAFGFTMDSKEGREVLEKCLEEFFR